MTKLEIAILRIRLVEAQMQVLNYQHKELLTELKTIQDLNSQSKFDAEVDYKDMPTGATTSSDQFSGD
jgi:hypothetical protein